MKQILTNLFSCAYNIPMQSNKAPKKTRKIAHESGAAADSNAAAEVTTTPRSAKSSTMKKAETADMGLANHQHKTSSALEPKVENTPAIKAMAAAATQRAAKPVSHEEIAKLAHSYWVARGYAHGSAEADWLRAEQELQAAR
jgi:hypothetical protein